MNTDRRWRFFQLTVAMVISMCCADVLGEEIDWLPGKAPVVSLESKINKSAGAARTIAVGSFELPQQKPALEPFSKDEAFVKVKFAVDKVFKGDGTLRGRTIELKLPIVLPGVAAAAPLTATEIKSAAEALQKLERDYEAKTLDERAYHAGAQSLRVKLVQSSGYLQQFVLVPLRTGGLDATHRSADALVKSGELYVLMLLKDSPADAVDQPLFPWELDVYSAADPQQMNLVTKSVGKR